MDSNRISASRGMGFGISLGGGRMPGAPPAAKGFMTGLQEEVHLLRESMGAKLAELESSLASTRSQVNGLTAGDVLRTTTGTSAQDGSCTSMGVPVDVEMKVSVHDAAVAHLRDNMARLQDISIDLQEQLSSLTDDLAKKASMAEMGSMIQSFEERLQFLEKSTLSSASRVDAFAEQLASQQAGQQHLQQILKQQLGQEVEKLRKVHGDFEHRLLQNLEGFGGRVEAELRDMSTALSDCQGLAQRGAGTADLGLASVAELKAACAENQQQLHHQLDMVSKELQKLQQSDGQLDVEIRNSATRFDQEIAVLKSQLDERANAIGALLDMKLKMVDAKFIEVDAQQRKQLEHVTGSLQQQLKEIKVQSTQTMENMVSQLTQQAEETRNLLGAMEVKLGSSFQEQKTEIQQNLEATKNGCVFLQSKIDQEAAKLAASIEGLAASHDAAKGRTASLEESLANLGGRVDRGLMELANGLERTTGLAEATIKDMNEVKAACEREISGRLERTAASTGAELQELRDRGERLGNELKTLRAACEEQAAKIHHEIQDLGTSLNHQLSSNSADLGDRLAELGSGMLTSASRLEGLSKQVNSNWVAHQQLGQEVRAQRGYMEQLLHGTDSAIQQQLQDLEGKFQGELAAKTMILEEKITAVVGTTTSARAKLDQFASAMDSKLSQLEGSTGCAQIQVQAKLEQLSAAWQEQHSQTEGRIASLFGEQQKDFEKHLEALRGRCHGLQHKLEQEVKSTRSDLEQQFATLDLSTQRELQAVNSLLCQQVRSIRSDMEQQLTAADLILKRQLQDLDVALRGDLTARTVTLEDKISATSCSTSSVHSKLEHYCSSVDSKLTALEGTTSCIQLQVQARVDQLAGVVQEEVRQMEARLTGVRDALLQKVSKLVSMEGGAFKRAAECEVIAKNLEKDLSRTQLEASRACASLKEALDSATQRLDSLEPAAAELKVAFHNTGRQQHEALTNLDSRLQQVEVGSSEMGKTFHSELVSLKGEFQQLWDAKASSFSKQWSEIASALDEMAEIQDSVGVRLHEQHNMLLGCQQRIQEAEIQKSRAASEEQAEGKRREAAAAERAKEAAAEVFAEVRAEHRRAGQDLAAALSVARDAAAAAKEAAERAVAAGQSSESAAVGRLALLESEISKAVKGLDSRLERLSTAGAAAELRLQDLEASSIMKQNTPVSDSSAAIAELQNEVGAMRSQGERRAAELASALSRLQSQVANMLMAMS